ncbi:MAG: preQ(1) synthase [Anaerolineae bacterium]|jgi:7-cyano-7-deazaguanine reductase|nr:NADPH-dependent 7-cyano-7-deazaguanine reductase QueF [Ardenticatenia bacterium]HQZ69990.1 preQ(1) synthase [Anaerolineae bacterium]HRA21619.1 preQ(1) synthase [Anaerolineae bacterium]
MATQQSDLAALTQLGREAGPNRKLEAFPNHRPDRYYSVALACSEFTCLCPLTGQPDFATIEVLYVPDKLVVESKSLKLYLWSFRDEGSFHEHVVNQMVDDLTAAIDPHWLQVTGRFHVRGGIGITVKAEQVKTPAAKAALWG